MKTTQELQNELNERVKAALNELVNIAEQNQKSKKALFQLIELNSKRIDEQDKIIDMLMSERQGRLN